MKTKDYTVGNVNWNSVYPGVFPGDRNHYVCVDDPKKVKDVDYLILFGGSDISPTIYGQKPHKAHAGEQLSDRDKLELEIVQAAIEQEKPMIGICRGAQLLCCVDGGSLWQHVRGHTHTQHTIVDYNGQILNVNSDHHQVMRPSADAFIIATTKESLSGGTKWDEEERKDDSPEPEIVYFPKINALGIQPHPEWAVSGARWVQYTRSLYREFLCL